MPKLSRRQVIEAAGGAAALALLSVNARGQQRLVLNDASGLSPTPVRAHWVVKPNDEARFIQRLRAEMKIARAEGRPIAVGAARHSMGGQSLPRDGTAITFDISRVESDRARKRYQVHAGTRWHQVIRALDPIGFSPAVMQSNADFGVAGTFSVNAHGWPVPYGPFGSTVRSIEMMLADGTILHCSRRENAELFTLAMGGYGYFGIILKLEVDMVPNVLLKPKFEVMPAGDFAKRFTDTARDPAVYMLYGRFNVARTSFLNEGMLVSFRAADKQPQHLPAATEGSAFLSRRIYRAQLNSEAGRKARWISESIVLPKVFPGSVTRNRLMIEPVKNLASNDSRYTDILHEYFVPPDRFDEFIQACRETILPSRQQMLNITLRYVAMDDESVMSFAPTPRIAAVISFAQEVSREGEARMSRLTEALIERVASIGGSFYLPYRLHARREQVARVYKNTDQFVARKRHYDPDLVFRNAMWPAYFG